MDYDRPDIRVSPQLALLAAVAAALALEWLAPLEILPPVFSSMMQFTFGVIDFTVSILIAFAAKRALERAGTSVGTTGPATVLVRSGPYLFTRNPIYLAMVIAMLGLAFMFSLDWALITGAALWALLNWAVVPIEEDYLDTRFGTAYADYRRTTRRWL